MERIKDCIITNSDAKVLREWCVDKNSPLYKEYKGYNTSINLETKEVFNAYTGYVAMVSGDKRLGYDVVVRINEKQAIRYCNLKSVNVKMRDNVDISQQIGEANKYVKVEYLTTKANNQYAFRLGDKQMYKDDPSKIIDPLNSNISLTFPQYSESGLMDFEEAYNGGDENYANDRTPIDYQQY